MKLREKNLVLSTTVTVIVTYVTYIYIRAWHRSNDFILISIYLSVPQIIDPAAPLGQTKLTCGVCLFIELLIETLVTSALIKLIS